MLLSDTRIVHTNLCRCATPVAVIQRAPCNGKKIFSDSAVSKPLVTEVLAMMFDQGELNVSAMAGQH